MKKYVRYVSITLASLMLLVVTIPIAIMIWFALWSEETHEMILKEGSGWGHLSDLIVSFLVNMKR